MAKKQQNPELLNCRNCVFCHSTYSPNFEGKNIMAKCEKSKFSVLLSMEQCKDFKNSKRIIL